MIRLVALLLTALTGFSGLVYEVTWQKYLATLLGSHSEATAAVLGLFLGGLALGYSLFGEVTRRLAARAQSQGRAAPLLIVYGAIEASIGVFALVFPLLFGAVQALSFLIPHGSAGLGFALDVALSALLVLPPAVLMGGTIPILTQALARSLDDATRFHALVYAFNTAGAFAGALAAGYWLVPSLGLVGVLVAMGVVNLVAGGVFLALGWWRPPTALRTLPAAETVGHVAGYAGFAAVAGLTGFAMMTLQSVLIRLGGLTLGSSQFTFSMVVAVFVLCIALGSFAVSALRRIPPRLLPISLWLLLLLLAVFYWGVEDLPYWAYALRSSYGNQDAEFYAYYLATFAALLAIIGLPVALAGAVLPLMFHALRERVTNLGNVAGRLYSWNTFGSLIGALIGGYALLYWLDLHHTYRIAMAAIALAAVLASGIPPQRTQRIGMGILLACSLAAIAALPAWRPERLNLGLFREQPGGPFAFAGPRVFYAEHPLLGQAEKNGHLKWIFHDDDPTASVTVTDKLDARGRHVRGLRTSGRGEGTLFEADTTMRLAGLLPAIFAEKMERVFVIGYGLGMTVGELAALRTLHEVRVAEISPAVIDAAPLFDYGTLNASTQPNVKIEISDAYRALIRSQGKFDAIVSIPSNTWVAGVEMLFSREFLAAAHARLEPGGVYVQWFHSNGFRSQDDQPDPLALALHTFATVFPHVAVWYGSGPELLILGLLDDRAALDLDRIEQQVRRKDVSEGLVRAEIRSLASLLAHELLPLGVVHSAQLPSTLHTLLHPRLGYLAARAAFTGSEGPPLPSADLETARIGQRNALQQRYAERFGGRLPDEERGKIIAQICIHRPRECQAQVAVWTRDVPDSPLRTFVTSALVENSQGRIQLNAVPALLPLVGIVAKDASPVSVADATQATELFILYYTHAAPFSREALADIWRRCEADPAQAGACRAGREAAERRLGPLSAGLAPAEPA